MHEWYGLPNEPINVQQENGLIVPALRDGLYSQQNGFLSQSKEGPQLALATANSAVTFAEVSFASRTTNEKLEKDASVPELNNYSGRKSPQ